MGQFSLEVSQPGECFRACLAADRFATWIPVVVVPDYDRTDPSTVFATLIETAFAVR